MRHLFLWIAILSFSFTGCTTKQPKPKLIKATRPDCQNTFDNTPLKDVLKTLATISDLYEDQCYHEVISLGDFVRTHSRDKFYHFVNETLEFVTPEGTFTEYTLESYERSYLSFLIASSYEYLTLQEDAEVELRRAYQENQALLYNYGDDPVNLVLQAALWENSKSPFNSRPLWKRAVELSGDNQTLRQFAENKIAEIDSGKKTNRPWRIFAVGHFPEMDWKTDLGHEHGSYFSIFPKSSFQSSCKSEESLLIPTEAWARKISQKYDKDYHPLLHLQTWTRAPVGLTLGTVTALTGAGLAVAGCGADAYLSKNTYSGGDLCKASMSAGGSIIGETGTVTGYVLRPDLRYWNQVPQAFWLTQAENLNRDYCKPTYTPYKQIIGPKSQSR